MSATGDEQPEPQGKPPSLWLVLAMPVSLVLTVFALGFGLLVALELEEGGEATPTTTETTVPGNEDGAAVYESQSCGGCHTLSAAGSTGITGPNLDETQLSEAEIAAVVTNGRGEGMPAFGDSLDTEEITRVAAYVSESAASP
jgi:mono/diheme cytochrome c family protein